MTSAKHSSPCGHCQLSEGTPRGDEGHPSLQGQSCSLLVSQARLFHNPHSSQTEQTGLALIPTRKDCLSTQLTTASAAENKRCQILPEELSHGWRPRGQCSRLVGSRPGQRDQGLQRSCCLEGEGWSGLFSINGQGSLGDRVLQEQGLQSAGSRGISDPNIRMASDPWVSTAAPLVNDYGTFASLGLLVPDRGAGL